MQKQIMFKMTTNQKMISELQTKFHQNILNRHQAPVVFQRPRLPVNRSKDPVRNYSTQREAVNRLFQTEIIQKHEAFVVDLDHPFVKGLLIQRVALHHVHVQDLGLVTVIDQIIRDLCHHLFDKRFIIQNRVADLAHLQVTDRIVQFAVHRVWLLENKMSLHQPITLCNNN